MRKIIVFCFLFASLAPAQRQSVVVLPSLADPESKITPKQLDLLTEEVRTIVTKTLPTKDFNLLKQSEVQEALGDEAFVNACEEGTCVGDLMKKVQANFGARCEIFTVSKQLYMKFELYGTLKGQSEAGTIDQFNEPVKNFVDMQAMVKNRIPAMFLKITKTPRENCETEGSVWIDGVCKTPLQIAQEACESKGNKWIGGTCKSLSQIACEATAGMKWTGGECKSTEQIDCESKGNEWVNGACKAPAPVVRPAPVAPAAGPAPTAPIARPAAAPTAAPVPTPAAPVAAPPAPAAAPAPAKRTRAKK